jgi:hypothetical protein
MGTQFEGDRTRDLDCALSAGDEFATVISTRAPITVCPSSFSTTTAMLRIPSARDAMTHPLQLNIF